MNLENPKNGENNNNDQHGTDNSDLIYEIDSSCSTPYVSAPSSPGRSTNNGYFFSAPASPMHFVLCSSSSPSSSSAFASSLSEQSIEFEFSARFSSNSTIPAGSMSSADELFLNGQIRPMKLSSHLQRPQVLVPLIDLNELEEEDEREFKFVKRVDSMVRGRDMRLHDRSLHRRTRSLSPLRSSPSSFWHNDDEDDDELQARKGDQKEEKEIKIDEISDELETKETKMPSMETTPSASASTSRSSSASRNSKRWLFLKDFLRSKSEGRGNLKDKFWYSFTEKKTPSSSSISKEKPVLFPSKRDHSVPAKKCVTGKPANGISKRRVPPSPHELHYTAKRAQAEEMRKKTFLPYRQGLFGCLGFSSKGYNAVNVFTRSLNPVSSR